MSFSVSRLRSRLLLRRLALASVIANVVIVVTGGAVRLTSSGLGCPTWPSCTDSSLIPTRAYALHGVIEFTNRQLTFLLSAVVLATLVVSVLLRVQVKLAVLLAASIPAQAVLGGVTVLTHLNPWAVASHFLLSMAIIATAFALWWRVGPTRAAVQESAMPAVIPRCAVGLLTLTAAVLAVGTVVTGSGPHAGASSTSAGGAPHRIHLSPGAVSHLHADIVMLLIGATAAFVVLARAAGGSDRVRSRARNLLVIELAQGLIGFVQYFTGVPAVLVGFHMLGACLVWVAALDLLAWTRTPAVRRPNRHPVSIREDSSAFAG